MVWSCRGRALAGTKQRCSRCKSPQRAWQPLALDAPRVNGELRPHGGRVKLVLLNVGLMYRPLPDLFGQGGRSRLKRAVRDDPCKQAEVVAQ